MPKKNKEHKGKKGSHSMNKGHSAGHDRESGNTGDYWQQGNKGSGNANWNQGSGQGSGNANGNPNLFPDLGNVTKAGCLPTLWARFKNAFSRSSRGGCLPKLSILLLPLLAAGVILLIAL